MARGELPLRHRRVPRRRLYKRPDVLVSFGCHHALHYDLHSPGKEERRLPRLRIGSGSEAGRTHQEETCSPDGDRRLKDNDFLYKKQQMLVNSIYVCMHTLHHTRSVEAQQHRSRAVLCSYPMKSPTRRICIGIRSKAAMGGPCWSRRQPSKAWTHAIKT